MRFFKLLIIGSISSLLFAAAANAADVTQTSNLTVDTLEIGTGSVHKTDGFDLTARGSSTGGTIIYGVLNARQSSPASSSSGPLNPSTTSTDSSVGTVDWLNAGNITSSDDSYATTDGGLSMGATSYYLTATNFGFSIPTGAVIDGIIVEWEKGSDANDIDDNAIRIIKGDTIGSTDKSVTTNWPTTDAYTSYGSSTDLWGETWTVSDINASGFGAALSAIHPQDFLPGGVPRIDHVRITVHYRENKSSTIFTQVHESFETSGSGAVYITGTGVLLLTGTGSDVGAPFDLVILSGAVVDLIVDNGLKGYWKFDEGDGEIAFDSSRFGNNGTLQGGQSETGWSTDTGTGGGINFHDPFSLEFDGNDDDVQITGSTGLNITSDLTISMWIKASSTAQHVMLGFYDGVTPFEGYGVGINITTTGKAAFWSGSEQAWTEPTSNTYNNGNWRHVGVTLDGTTLSWYLDGVADGSSTIAVPDNYTGNRNIGRSQEPSPLVFLGNIDDVRVYDRALSSDEIRTLSNGFQYTGSGYYLVGSNLEVNGDVGIYAGTLDMGTSNSKHPDETVSGSIIEIGRSFINHAGFVTGSGGIGFAPSNSEVDTINVHSNKIRGSSHFQSFQKVGSTGTGEFYTVQSLGISNATRTPTNVVTLVVDRSGEVGTKDFIVIGSWSIGNEDVSVANSSGALIVDNVAQNDADLIEYEADNEIRNEMVMSQVSLTAASHTIKISLQGSSNTSTDEAIMQSASLIVWEKPPWLSYAESLGETDDNDADSTFETSKVTVTYDAFSEDVLIVGSMDINWADASAPGAVRLVDEGGSEIMRHEPFSWDVLTDNDNEYHPISMIALLENQNGRDLTAGIQTKDNGTGDHTRIKNARLFALPLSSFNGSQVTNSDQVTTSSSYADLLTHPAKATGSYIVFFGSQLGSSSVVNSDLQIKSPSLDTYEIDTTGSTTCREYDGSDNGSTPCAMARTWGGTGSGGTAWEMEYKTASAINYNADRNSIVVIDPNAGRNSLTIDNTSKQQFSGSVILYGETDNNSTIRSSSGGSQVLFNGTGTYVLDFLNVNDNDASQGKNFNECPQGNCVFTNTSGWDSTIITSGTDFTLIFEDTFTRSSTANLENHTPVSTGDSWTAVVENGCSGDCLKIISFNDYVRCDEAGSRDGAVYTADVTYASADYVVEALMVNVDTNDDYTWMAARIQDASNMYAVRILEGEGILFKRVAGTWSSIGSNIIDERIERGVTIYIRVVGDTISWGIGRLSVNTGEELDSVTDTSHSDAGKAGFGMGDVGENSDDDCSGQKIDNFRVYTTVVAAAAAAAPPSGIPSFFQIMWIPTWMRLLIWS